jgi:uncharacterized protein YndB with AHSA1/START domain
MKPDGITAEVRRSLDAPPERVFGAFTTARMVGQWLSPSPEVPLTVLQYEFHVGGMYRFMYLLPGGRTMMVNGTFRSIAPPALITFSWNIEPPDEHAGLESEVTVKIRPAAGGTELLVRHELLTLGGSAARHAQGWSGAVDRLTVLLEGNAYESQEQRTC